MLCLELIKPEIKFLNKVNAPGARGGCGYLQGWQQEVFPCLVPSFCSGSFSSSAVRAVSQIREMMILKIKPNVILLLGPFRASSVPRLLGGAISGRAGTEGAWLRAQDQL